MSERSTVLELEVEVLDVLVLGTNLWAARRLVVNELAGTETINPAATRFAGRVPVPGRASQGLEELGRVGHSTMMSGGPGNPPAGPRRHGSREPPQLCLALATDRVRR